MATTRIIHWATCYPLVPETITVIIQITKMIIKFGLNENSLISVVTQSKLRTMQSLVIFFLWLTKSTANYSRPQPFTTSRNSASPVLKEYDEVPVIDLSQPDEVLIEQIVQACSTHGFFQVTSHNVPLDLFREQMKDYFALSHATKIRWKRNERNARGYFDDELTKRKRDWKECLDFGVPGSRDWNLDDFDAKNACLDGYNIFPSNEELPDFRPTVIDFFEDCAKFSNRLAILMAQGLGLSPDDDFIQDMKENHTSYLRLNSYPPCPTTDDTPEDQTLGISPHRDAGFLTILIQDDDCHSLQVYHENSDKWITVHPVAGALTINTGDMAMIWSNGKYRAPLHRVRTDPLKRRYSAPFFYNPGYASFVKPWNDDAAVYRPCLWGYFRAVRFAGDLTDFGVEIQTNDFLKAGESTHTEKQKFFETKADFQEAFSVETYRPLLQDAFESSSHL